MALDLDTLKGQCNVTTTDDDALLTRLLAAAQAKVESDLGYLFEDTDELPSGPTADLEQAVLMTAAHWYENREAVLVGLAAQTLPIAAADIVANTRTYSFASDE